MYETSTDYSQLGMLWIIYLVLLVVMVIALWKVFTKAGKPGWAAIVPIYNGWVLFEISGKPGWWILLGIIPFVGPFILIVLSLLAALELAKRFSKSAIFGVVGLWLFSVIGYLILAFGSAKYQAGGGVQPLASADQEPGAPHQDNSPPPPQAPPTPPSNLVQ